MTTAAAVEDAKLARFALGDMPDSSALARGAALRPASLAPSAEGV